MYYLAFHVAQPRFDRIADAEEQIKLGSDYLNQGSIDMVINDMFDCPVSHSHFLERQWIVITRVSVLRLVALVISILVFVISKWVNKTR